MSENEFQSQMLKGMDTMQHKQDRIERMLEQQILRNKEILTARETALYMGCSVSWVYKLRRHHHLRGSKPNNGRLYFARMDVNYYLLSEAQGKPLELAPAGEVAGLEEVGSILPPLPEEVAPEEQQELARMNILTAESEDP